MNLSGKTSEGALVRTAEDRLPPWLARLAGVKSSMVREEAGVARIKQTPTISIPATLINYHVMVFVFENELEKGLRSGSKPNVNVRVMFRVKA